MKKIMSFILLLVVGMAVCHSQARDLKGLSILEPESGGINAVTQKAIDSSVKFQLGGV